MQTRALTNALIGMAAALMTLLVALHLGLVFAGHWQGDEYFSFAMLRDLGWSFIRARLVYFSPRPVSEALLILYYRAVEAFHNPVIGPFLLLLWTGLIASTLTTLRRPRPSMRLLMACSLLTMFLLGHSVGEMFYWPMAAAAYVPTLAALTFMFFRLVDGRPAKAGERILFAIALSVAAGSSEVGAAFVICFAGIVLAGPLIPGLKLRWSVPDTLLVGLPLVFALALVALHLHFRQLAPQGETAGALGRPLLSLFAGLPELVRDIVALDEASTGTDSLLIGVTVKALLFVGFRWCCLRLPDGGRSRFLLVGFALSLLGAALISITAAHYEYGLLCCQRHGTLRECMIMLALASLAALPARAGRPIGHTVAAQLSGPLALLLATGIAAAPRLPALAHDYRQYGKLVQARVETWRSGEAPGTKMGFRLSPHGEVVGYENLPLDGSATMSDNAAWYVKGILLFFRKGAMETTSSD